MANYFMLGRRENLRLDFPGHRIRHPGCLDFGLDCGSRGRRKAENPNWKKSLGISEALEKKTFLAFFYDVRLKIEKRMPSYFFYLRLNK